jgi:hypothetical protein
LELPNYITFVLKKNTAFTYNKRVSSGSSEKHVQQAIQEIFGEPPSPQRNERLHPEMPDFFIWGQANIEGAETAMLSWKLF